MMDWQVDPLLDIAMELHEANALWDAQALGKPTPERAREIVRRLRWIEQRAGEIAEKVASSAGL